MAQTSRCVSTHRLERCVQSREGVSDASYYTSTNEFTCARWSVRQMLCELNDLDWYTTVGSGLFTLGVAITLGIFCLKDDVKERVYVHGKRIDALEEKVDHNHKHYEKEVLIMLKEALNQSPRSAQNSVCDNNSIPGGE